MTYYIIFWYVYTQLIHCSYSYTWWRGAYISIKVRSLQVMNAYCHDLKFATL